MLNTFSPALSWLLVGLALVLILYHIAKIFRQRALQSGNGAAIIFGMGVLLIELPRHVYDLTAEEFDAIGWLGAAAIAMSFALEFWDRRTKHRGTPSERPGENA